MDMLGCGIATITQHQPIKPVGATQRETIKRLKLVYRLATAPLYTGYNTQGEKDSPSIFIGVIQVYEGLIQLLVTCEDIMT